MLSFYSARRVATIARQHSQKPIDEDEEDAEGSSRQDLRHALVYRPEASGLGLAGWQADNLGRLHDQQSPRHSSPIFLGHDMRLFP